MFYILLVIIIISHHDKAESHKLVKQSTAVKRPLTPHREHGTHSKKAKYSNSAEGLSVCQYNY